MREGLELGLGFDGGPPPRPRPRVLGISNSDKGDGALNRLRTELNEQGFEVVAIDERLLHSSMFATADLVLIVGDNPPTSAAYRQKPQAPVIVWLGNQGDRSGYASFYRWWPDLQGPSEEIVVFDAFFGPLATIKDSISFLLSPDLGVCTVDPLTPGHVVTLTNYWQQIIDQVTMDIGTLHHLDDRVFEEFIAELLSRDGFRVQLTQATRDGGRDILAWKDSFASNALHYVECKKYAPNNKVGIELVQRLYGVFSDEPRAVTGGVLVTTSSFTQPALDYAEMRSHRLALRDMDNIKDWVAKIRSQRA